MRISDWSSDVCSSDLPGERLGLEQRAPRRLAATLAGQPRLDRQVPLLLQAQLHLGVAGGLHLAVERLAAAVEGFVVVEGHHASSVTHSTSSIVVSPASALTMPSSYTVRMPDWRANCSSSPMSEEHTADSQSLNEKHY